MSYNILKSQGKPPAKWRCSRQEEGNVTKNDGLKRKEIELRKEKPTHPHLVSGSRQLSRAVAITDGMVN